MIWRICLLIVGCKGLGEIFTLLAHNPWINHFNCNNLYYLISGTVIRVSTVKLLEYERDYICARCKHIFGVQADFEQFYSIPKPSKCPSSKECNSNKFSCLSDGGKWLLRDFPIECALEWVTKWEVGGWLGGWVIQWIRECIGKSTDQWTEWAI